MKQYVYDFYGENELEEVIDRFRQERREKAGLFITLYHESNDLEKVKESIQTLRKAFPQSAIAGMSASGGIKDGRMVLGKSVLAFLSFEDTEVSVHCYDISSMTPGEAGERALESFSGIRNLAGVEVFTTLSTVNVDDFLTELDHLPPETAIFGGGADAYTGGDDTCVFGNDFISRKAIVAVCFAGKVKIRVSQNLGWQPLGQVMTITAIDGDKVIRELDGRPAFQVYEKYLKMKKSDFGGQQLISFPLILMRKGRMLARLPAACRDDGSLIMSASCFEGEKVRLAYGDPNEIIARCQENTKQLRTFAPEGILIFSCITRRLFLKEDANQVLAPYGALAPVCGGYSRGEISRSGGRTSALNMTLVAAAFREKEENGMRQEEKSSEGIVFHTETMTTIQRLASFIARSTEELEQANRRLEEVNRKLVYVATHDGLTGLLNRGRVESILHELTDDRQKNHHVFTAIMVDLDNFKGINDEFGHGEGDRVLQEVADVFSKKSPSNACIGRWGGDEFVILLPRMEEEEAAALAETLRKTIEETVSCPDRSPVSASLGVTQAREGETFESFYHKMDSALYQAKFRGKNTIFLM